jgi:hypothetical protein
MVSVRPLFRRSPTHSLDADVVEALRPHFPADFDFAGVRLRTGIPRWAAGRPDAVTFRRTVYVSPACFEPGSARGIVLLAHELAHVEQFCRLGTLRFAARYLAAYFRRRLSGLSRHAAYTDIPLECAARAVESRVAASLGQRTSPADTLARTC